MAYVDYVRELAATVPRLPEPYARTLINRAWKEIQDRRLWSWLTGNADQIAPVLVSTGTVTVTQGSTSIALDATAAAALSPLVTATPPLASTTLGTGRQIRMGNTGSGGPIYNIVAADFVGNTLTIDRVYAGPSGAAQPYQVYKCYFGPPDTNFLRYFTVTNMTAGYVIRQRRLYFNQTRLNAIDPQRGGNGDARILAEFGVDSTGRPVTEWYPHPTNFAVYNCHYQKRATVLSSTQDLPATFDESCLMAKASILASEWAQANIQIFPQLAQTNWVMWRQGKEKSYQERLVTAARQDEEMFPQIPFVQGDTVDFPLGGEFLQSHDLSSILGGL